METVSTHTYVHNDNLIIVLWELFQHIHIYIMIPWITGRGKGVTSAWSPLGNFLEGQAHPNLHRTRFCYFFDVKFFVFAFRWFFTEVVMFIFE